MNRERSVAVGAEWFPDRGRVWLLLLLVVYVVSRGPFLPLGFGTDDDAWYMAAAADNLASTGRYTLSRTPGYPTAELWYGFAFRLLGSTPVAGNTAAALVGLLGAVGLGCVVRRHGGALPLLGAAALAFHPAYWIASVTTMDPVISAVLVVYLLLALLDGQPVVAGVFLGLALGARITNGLAWIPAVLYLIRGRGNPRGAAAFTASAAVVGASMLALPFSTMGTAFFHYTPVLHRDYLTGGYRAFRDLLGVPVGLVFLLLAGRRLVRGAGKTEIPSGESMEGLLLVAGLGGVLTAPFLLLPIDSMYLLPLVPLAIAGVLMAAGLGLLRKVSAAWILSALMVSSLVGVGELDVGTWRREHRLRVHLLGPGRVLQHREERREVLLRGRRAAGLLLPPHSVVILGRPFLPWLYFRGTPVRELGVLTATVPETDTLVVRLLWPELRRQVSGRRIYYASGEDLPYLTRRIFGYSLEETGARELVLW